MTEQLKTDPLFIFAHEVIHGAYRPEELKDAAMRAIRHHSAKTAQAVPDGIVWKEVERGADYIKMEGRLPDHPTQTAQAVPVLSEAEIDGLTKAVWGSAAIAPLSAHEFALAIEQAVWAKMGEAVPQTKQALKDAMYALQVPHVPCQDGLVARCMCRKCVVTRCDAALSAPQQAEAVQYTRADLDRAYSAGLVEGERLAIQQTEAVPSDVVRDAMVEAACGAVAAALGDAYDCGRVWSAWSYGTMGPDDFSQVSEDSDRVREIAVAAIDAAIAQQKGASHE